MLRRRQGLNATIRATLRRVAPGQVEIEVPFSSGVSQQHDFFHGGVMGAIGDSACGYAAMTLTLPSSEVLTIEYKVNFLSPGQGELLVARGRVTKPGRTDRKSTRLNSSHRRLSRMPSSA